MMLWFSIARYPKRTDIQKHSPIRLLVHNMILKDLVVQSSWLFGGGRHLD